MKSLPYLPLLALLAAPAWCDEKDQIRDALKKSGEYAARGERLAAIQAEYAAATHWVRKAILLVEIADLADRRGVAPLAKALEDKHDHVVSFGLHGLKRQSDADLKKGGGDALINNLIEALKSKIPFHVRTAHGLLVKITGEDHGIKGGSKWKAWLKKNPDAMKIELEDLRFDDRRFDPDLVTQVLNENAQAGTVLRDRIPDISSEINELAEYGLDIALCLDQTGSMGAVIDATKANMTLLCAVIGQVIKDYRVGLVTFDDGVRKNEPLSNNVAGLVQLLEGVKAEGGGDIPEGVDKALKAALDPAFGWRKKSTKTVVILGDAPPHAEDMDATVKLAEQAHKAAAFVINGVSTGMAEIPEFKRIAEAGGGRSLISSPEKLISEILLLIFGQEMRPAMERFVPVLLEILQQKSLLQNSQMPQNFPKFEQEY